MRVPPTTLREIPEGPEGIRETLRLMRSLCRQFKTDSHVRTLALQIVRGAPQKGYRAEAVLLHSFVRDHIRYVRDTHGVETVQWPTVTIELGQGDCDDKSLLLATLLESIGHPTRFRAVGFQPNTQSYSHVLVDVRMGKGWFPLETTEPVPAGWSPAGVKATMVIHN